MEAATPKPQFGDLHPIQIVLLAFFGAFAVWFSWVLSPDPEEGVKYTIPIPEQCDPEWKGEVLESPSIKVEGSNDIRCYCPANGKLLGYVSPATTEYIDTAIAEAQAAQREWAKTTFSQRRRVLKTMLKYVLENQDTIATMACLDSGKTRVDALFGEILVTAEKLKWTIDHGEKALKPESRPTNLLMLYKKNEVRWEPLGVIAACVSWNYPFHNLIGPVISSLFSGNAILVKGSEQTAWSSNFFASVAREALVACGHSPEIVKPITCWPDVAEYLTSHPSIAHITFIGSKPVAHHVARSASKTLTPLCVELGGKDPSIILDDAQSDLGRIVPILMRGVFQAAGQNCIGIERVIALPKIYPKLVELIEPLVKSLRVGSALDTPLSGAPVDVGAQVSSASFDRLESLIAEAVRDGARLLAGGKRYNHPDFPSGHYFAPTLIVDVTPEMSIAQNELFAPVFVIMRAESVEDALRIANGTIYGLGSSIFGRNSRHLQYLTDNLQAGMVAVNDFAAYYAVQLPFGGVKGSGYGRFAGEEGLRGISNQKAVCRDRFPWIAKTAIPAKVSLPATEKTGAAMWEFAKGIPEVGYGESLTRRVKGVSRLVK